MSNLPEQPVRWRNASSGQQTCVDLAHTRTAVRDSKAPACPALRMEPGAFDGLLFWVKTSE